MCLQDPDVPLQAQSHEWALLLLFQLFYLLFLFTFSLLSTAAVVFIVASLYTAKPVSFFATMFAIPSVFCHLFHTFIRVSLLMLAYNLIFIILLVLIVLVINIAMKKSYELLKGKVFMAGVLVFGYLSICGLINWIFEAIMIRGDTFLVWVQIQMGGFLIASFDDCGFGRIVTAECVPLCLQELSSSGN
ncbi:hypothetical protein Cgig2_020996 [Carnegiea gigantea]|uniref:Uncharacterized protein n=1 Tax=Carnegiea gigantea TaxID=171969 RepID=A0A9Q1QGI0_9CARY|nr:hypothetical protein Cgig2_020996 [Carnegiea gigantea]